MDKIMPLENKSYEELKKSEYVLTITNGALKGCIKYCKKEIEQIKEFAETHEFDGDMFIAATANNILDVINTFNLDEKEQ